MGALGDKFKKLAGDQTRQLLQNFQNAQSSKTKNGYSYGKLNEDGTATLADGTTVQVEVKGRPGQYAPVFNLGNGQGLVDQPEAKFFNIDSAQGVHSYVIRVNLYQKYPVSIYQDQIISGGTIDQGAIYYFNLIDFSSITLMDRISNTVYTVDPSTYSGLSSLPMPFFSVKAFSFAQYYKFIAGNGLNITGSFNDNQLRYAYSGAYVEFGSEGKDILIYQTSTINLLSARVLTTSIISFVDEQNVGPLFFNYWILKDFYFEDGLVKAAEIIQGQYTPEPSYLSLKSENSGIALYTDNGVFNERIVKFKPYLCRDADDLPRLDLDIVEQSFSEVVTTAVGEFLNTITTTDYEGSQHYFVKGVNSFQSVTWKETYDSRIGLFDRRTGAYTHGGLIYGLGTSDDGLTYYRLNTETYAPGSVIDGLGPSPLPRNAVLLASNTTYLDASLAPLYFNIGALTGGDYGSSQNPGSSIGPSSPPKSLAGLNSSDTAWVGVYTLEGKIRFVRYYLNDGDLTYTKLSGSEDYNDWFSYLSAPYTLDLGFGGPYLESQHPSATITY